MVDLAVAACAGLDVGARVLHLDLHRHQSVLTRLAGTTRLRRSGVDVASRVGLVPLHAAWAQLISEAMVRRTRFDPLHQAATEQQLHQRLPGWLEALAQDEAVEVTIDSGSGSFSATLRREQFALAAEAYYSQLVECVRASVPQGSTTHLVLSARAAGLPALRERLAAVPGLEMIPLPEIAAAQAAAQRLDELRVEGEAGVAIALDRRFPLPTQAAARRTGRAPTHLVHAGRAHAISAEPLVLGTATASNTRHLALEGSLPGVSRRHCSLVAGAFGVQLQDHSRHGTWINEERVSTSQQLLAGDRLRLGTPGLTLELVAVD